MWIKLIAAFLAAHYIVNVVVLKLKVKLKIRRRIKPFDCIVCLSVWLALALWFMPGTYAELLTVLFGAGFLANKIE